MILMYYLAIIFSIFSLIAICAMGPLSHRMPSIFSKRQLYCVSTFVVFVTQSLFK
jgi:hypothetical protein